MCDMGGRRYIEKRGEEEVQGKIVVGEGSEEGRNVKNGEVD